jgi:hypothetical protein
LNHDDISLLKTLTLFAKPNVFQADKKTPLATSIEQYHVAAIAATTPRGHRANETIYNA